TIVASTVYTLGAPLAIATTPSASQTLFGQARCPWLLAVAENHPPRVEMERLKITHLLRPKRLASRVDQWIDFGHVKLSQDGSDQHHQHHQHHLRLAKAELV